jgi:hypothetical protein
VGSADEPGGSTARSGPQLEELLARAQAQQQALLAENEALQRRARAAMDERAKGRPRSAAQGAKLEGADARYT